MNLFFYFRIPSPVLTEYFLVFIPLITEMFHFIRFLEVNCKTKTEILI